jgi:tetratricopeptide (TPR) repeat protein
LADKILVLCGVRGADRRSRKPETRRPKADETISSPPANLLGSGGVGSIVAILTLLALWPVLPSASGTEADTNPPPATASETNSQETLRAYLQLQEQLHLTQLAIEQNRKEARETAAQNSDLLAGRLQTIEKELESQRARELETMQSSNRTMLLVAGTFAAVGFIAMLLMSFFQWRTVNRLAEIAAALPASLALGQGPSRAASGSGESHLVTVGPAEQSSVRLLGALEELEKRIYELEHTTRTPLSEGPAGGNGGKGPPSISSEHGGSALASREGPDHSAHTGAELDRITLLMGKGQSMLSLDDAQGAIACFDDVLTIDPKNAEALVRKGAALERLQRLNEAVECYDRAIAADNSLTIAYLHKGGLFNRMERFTEALECYEKALRTQEKRRG